MVALPIVPQHAEAQAGPRVLLVEAEGSELAARIAGQTRDLALRLETAGSRAPDFAAADAQAIADRAGAAAVVWIAAREDGGLQVHVLDALRRSDRTRELAPQPAQNEALAASALYEAAALVVRGELSNLLEQENLAARAADADAARASGTGGTGGTGATGGTGGTAVDRTRDRDGDGTPDAQDDDDDNDGVPDADDDDDDDADADDASDESDQPAGASHHGGPLFVRAGFRVARVDSDHAAYGPLLGLGVDIGHAAISLQATTSWPIEVDADEVDVRLRRHAITLHPLVQLTDSRHWRLLAGVDAGVVLYARKTERASGTLSATDDRTTLSATFGATGELQWLASSWLHAGLTIGLDVLTGPTKFALERRNAEQQQVVHEMATFEPWATLSINITP